MSIIKELPRKYEIEPRKSRKCRNSGFEDSKILRFKDSKSSNLAILRLNFLRVSVARFFVSSWFIFTIFLLLTSVFASAETFTLSENLYNEGIMGVSMRALGMGGAFVHIANENPIYYNPAALLQTTNYKLANNSAFFIGRGYLFSNFLLVRLTDTWFLSLLGTNDGNVGYIFSGGYALPLGKFFSLGFNGKGILREDSVGLGCDVGFLGKVSIVSFGIMVQDLITKIGQDLKPMVIKIGLGIEPIRGFGINLQGDLNEIIEGLNISFKPTLRAGLEGRLFKELIGMRVGYANFQPDEYSLTGGLGINFKYLSFNYTYVSSWKTERNIDNAHWISAEFFFWPKSPEEIAKEMMEKEERDRTLLEETRIKEEKLGKKTEEEKKPQRKSGKSEFDSLYSDLEKTKSELLVTNVELEKMRVYSSQLEKELKKTKSDKPSSPLQGLRNSLPREVWTRSAANGIIIVLSGEIFFPSGSPTVNPASYSILDEIAGATRDYSHYKIKVEGYTDSTGAEEKNITLSASRAQDVANYIISKGIAKERIVTINGYGSKNPIASNLTESGRLSNRRVEITIYE